MATSDSVFSAVEVLKPRFNVFAPYCRKVIKTTHSRAEFLAMTLLDIRPAEDIPGLIRATQDPRQSTAESWRHKSKDGVVFSVVITSWELNFEGHPAELVLACTEGMALPQELSAMS